MNVKHKWPWLARELDRVNPGEDLVVLRCSIGRFGDEGVLRRSDTELAETALADLARVTGLRGAPAETRVTRWTDGLPQYAVGHASRVERVRSAVGRHPGLGVCGAAYGGVGIPACVADAGREAEHLADALLDHTLSDRGHGDRGHTDGGDQSAAGPNQQGVNP